MISPKPNGSTAFCGIDTGRAARYLSLDKNSLSACVWGKIMKSFVIAVIFAAAAAYGASLVLDHFQRPVETAFATSGVRL
jgi:hypothetical protein